MNTLWWIAAVVLLLNVVAGLAFLTTRKSSPESVLVVLFFGTNGVALTLTLGKAMDLEHAKDVAMVFALLAATLGVAFTRRGWFSGGEQGGVKP